MQSFPSGQFPGSVSAQREAGGFLFTETRYNENQILRKHSHDYACFVVVYGGCFVETLGTNERFCGPADIIFRYPGEVHANHFGFLGGRCLTIEIAARRLEGETSEFLQQDHPTFFNSLLLTNIARRLFLEFHTSDPGANLALEGLTLELMAEASRLKMRLFTEGANRKVERVREIIHEQFSADVSLSRLAELVGLHPSHLSREFRKRYGFTVGEYVRNQRVRCAGEQLSSTDLPIVEIALNNGFTDQSQFSKTFKQIVGVPPARFRALTRLR